VCVCVCVCERSEHLALRAHTDPAIQCLMPMACLLYRESYQVETEDLHAFVIVMVTTTTMMITMTYVVDLPSRLLLFHVCARLPLYVWCEPLWRQPSSYGPAVPPGVSWQLEAVCVRRHICACICVSVCVCVRALESTRAVNPHVANIPISTHV